MTFDRDLSELCGRFSDAEGEECPDCGAGPRDICPLETETLAEELAA